VSEPSLIGYFDALALVFEHTPATEFETVPIEHLSGRMLGEPVIATRDHPAFDASAVDGYAISETDVQLLVDTAIEVRVAGTMGPGEPQASSKVWPGHAIHVLTGAPVPEGAVAIVMQEQARVRGSSVDLSGPATRGDHIRRRAEEFVQGDHIVPAGVRAHAGVVAAAAMTGKPSWRVGKAPAVAILVSGDELIPAGSDAAEGNVFDSHTPALTAALRPLHIEPAHLARCGDGEAETTAALEAALHAATVVLTTGGVSGGERDYIRRALAGCSLEEVFAGVRMKPGRPVVFAKTRTAPTKYVFGLPGNPMAALIAFATLVKPFLQEASGLVKAKPEFRPAILATEIASRRGSSDFVPVALRAEGDKLLATPLEGRRSHMFGALALANGLAMLSEREGLLPAGAAVPVMPWP
jgi:molybdopterin molybdotransferase